MLELAQTTKHMKIYTGDRTHVASPCRMPASSPYIWILVYRFDPSPLTSLHMDQLLDIA
jgi:hypothetical protein